MTDAIQVAVRVRPLNRQELESGQAYSWNIQGNSLVALDDGRDTKYALDHVFGPEWTTRKIYEKVAHGLLHKVISGFNSTVFAYGQTSSGKTFTMRGCDEEPGIIPLAVREIFRLIDSLQDREFLLRVSYMELYNEEVNDLLAPQNVKLPVHESKENGVYVCGLREDIVTCPEAVLSLLEQGEANRHIGSTKMNEKSSRSHTVFRMVVESRARDSEVNDASAILVSTLTLVDLAGSERVAKTGAEGLRMKEGTAINKSLLTLGNVINKLSEGALMQGTHIPYRDSKLTRILQPSLGGNAKTAIIAAMTPAACHLEESHSTLRFACRAKRVVNNAVVNEVLSDAAVLKRQAHEIEELKRKIAASGMNAEVESQIGLLRGQLLHSEQEKELMRIKLEEEKMEREKAQKQVEMARKMMFESGPVRDDPQSSKRNSRRETWCPGGKLGWAAPPGAAEAMDAATMSSARKRPLSLLHEESATEVTEGGEEQVGVPLLLGGVRGSTILEEEGDEVEGPEEGGAGLVMGPTPQRRRTSRASRASSIGAQRPEDDDEATEYVLHELQRLAKTLRGQDRSMVEFAATGWRASHDTTQALRAQVESLTQQTDGQAEDIRSATAQVQSLSEERDQLLPALEKERWQQRQLERKLAETAEANHQACKDRDVLSASVAELQQAVEASRADARNAQAAWKEERAALKEQVKALMVSLSDAQDALSMEAQEKAMMEAKLRTAAGQADAATAKLHERAAELEALAKKLEASQECTQVVEARARDLSEVNQRLEAHVRDLESRKRPPLYQKKQEEELRSANEKAAEAEARALEMDLKAKELKAAAEAAERRASELEEEAERTSRLVAQMATDVTEKHSMELQRLALERAKLIAQHEEHMSALNTQLQSMVQQAESTQAELANRDDIMKQLQEQLAGLRQQYADMESAQGELQACMAAASERIAQLEQDAEAASTAHEQQVEQLSQELTQTKASTSERQSHLESEISTLQASLESRAAEAQAELAALALSSEQAVAAARTAVEEELAAARNSKAASVAEAARVQEGYKAQIDGLNAKLIEAAGALRAKEELKEERMKHKQELSSMKSELQKLQLESKTGAKGKEQATKELEGLRKKVADLEIKLKTALQDRSNAVQEKTKLESQLKQYEGQKQLMQKTIEKQGAIENKKRESIMVNLNKKSEALSSIEERLKSATVELQKVQMDLEAKKGECQGLEQQVSQLETSLAAEREAHNAASMQLTTVQHTLECLQNDHKEGQAQLTTISQQLEELQQSHASQSQALSLLQAEHDSQSQRHQQASEELVALTANHATLGEQHATASKALVLVQQERDQLAVELAAAREQLQAVQAALTVAEDARIAAESRLPELEELQQQLSSAHEQMSDMRFAEAADKAAAMQAAQEAAAQQEELNKQAQAAREDACKAQTALVESQAQCADLQQQLDQAVELYTAVQGQCDALQAVHKEAQQQLSEAKKTAQQQAETLAEVASKRSQAEQQATAFQEQVSSLQQQLQEQVSVVQHQLQQQQVSSLESQLQQQVASLEGQLQAARDSAMAAKSEADAALSAATADGARQVQQLQEQLEQMTQEMTDLDFSWNQERAAAAQELAQVRSQLEAAQAAGPKELAQHMQQQALERQALETQLAGAVEHASALQGQLAEAARGKASIQEQLDEAVTRRASLQEQLAQAVEGSAAIQEQLAGSEERLAALAVQLAETHKAGDALQSQLIAVTDQATELQAQLADSTASRASLANELDEVTASLSALQQQLAAAEHGKAVVQHQLAEASEHATALQLQLTKAVESRAALQAQLAQGGATNSNQLIEAAEHTAALQQQLLEAVQRATSLDGQLDEALDNKATLTTQLAAATEQAMALARQLEDAAEEKTALSIQAEAALASQGLLGSQLAEAAELKAAAESLAAYRQNDVDLAQSQVESMQQDLEALRSGCMEMQGELASLLQERNRLMQELIGLKQQQQQPAEAFLPSQGFMSPLPPHQPSAVHVQDDTTADLLGPLGSPIPVPSSATSGDAGAEAAQQIQELTARLSASEAHAAQLEGQREQLLLALDQLSAQLAAVEAARAEAGGQLEAAQQQVHEKDQALQEACVEYTEGCRQLADVQLELEQAKDQLKQQAQAPAATPSGPGHEQLQALQQLVSELQQQLHSAEAQAAGAELHTERLHGLLAEIERAEALAASSSQRCDELASQLSDSRASLAAAEQQLETAKLQSTAIQQPATGSPGPEPGSSTGRTAAEVHELVQRIQSLEQEAAEAQAAANRASADKVEVERSLSSRVLHLERTVFELTDQLAEARGVPLPHTTATAAPEAPMYSQSMSPSPSPRAAPLPQTHAFVGAHPGMSSRLSDLEECLTAEVATLQTRLEQLQAARLAAEVRLADELHQSKEMVAALEQDVEQRRREGQVLEEQLLAARASVAALQIHVESHAARDTRIGGDAQQVQLELQAAQRDMAALAQRMADETQALSAVRLQATELEEALAGAREAHATELAARKVLTVRVQELEAAEQSSSGLASQALAAAEEARSACGDAQAQLAATTEKLQVAEHERWVSQDGLARSQRNLSEATAQLTAAQAELAALIPQLEQHQATAKAVTQQASGLEAQLSTAQGRASSLAEAMQQQERAMASKVEALSQQVVSLQQERDELLGAQTALQQAFGEAQAHVLQLQQQLQEQASASGAAAGAQAAVVAGPTAQQQALMARMAERLEALEAGHREALQRLHEEVAAASCDRQAAVAESHQSRADLDQAKHQHAIAMEEAEWAAKSKEAELNARVLSLESQIHWLGEQNTQLQASLAKISTAESGGASGPDAGRTVLQGAGGATNPAGATELEARCQGLEAELRKTKRAELKLQALLYRLRKDVEEAGGNVTALDTLRDTRSLEYEVDTLAQKLKRAERQVVALEAERAHMKTALSRANPGATAKLQANPAGETAALAGKENRQ